MIEDGLEDAVDIGSGNFSARLHRALEALYARMSILWDVYDSISERIDIAGRLAGTWVISTLTLLLAVFCVVAITIFAAVVTCVLIVVKLMVYLSGALDNAMDDKDYKRSIRK